VELFSEEFAATGSASAEAYAKILGRLELDFWSVFIRETIQNTWDAGKRGQPVASKYHFDDTVEYGIDLKNFKASEWKQAFSGIFSSTTPGPLNSVENQTDWSKLSQAKKLLIIYDRNTTGMGGPTTPDNKSKQSKLFDTGEVPSDFADFIFEWGVPQDTPDGGGTYGFGKSVLYSPSLASTIVVHTHCLDENGKPSQRLIASSLAQSGFEEEGTRRLTGRHWWGNTEKFPSVGPVTGDEAEALASLIGFPKFQPDQTGTTIGVISPDLLDADGEALEDDQFMEYLQHASLWHCWPKLISEFEGKPEMRFNFSIDSDPLPEVAPEDIASLKPFVEAFTYLSDGEDEYTRTLKSTRPKKTLGTVSVSNFLEDNSEISPTPLARPFGGSTNHVALMRMPNLVVNYEKQRPHPSEKMGFAGVFKAEKSMDSVFKQLEPPAHDVWVSKFPAGSQMEKPNYGNVAKTRIKEFIEETITNKHSLVQSSSDSLGVLSHILGNLFVGGTGTGLDDPGPGPGPGPGTPKAKVTFIDSKILPKDKENILHFFSFEVTHAKGTGKTTVKAKVSVAIEGGKRESPNSQGGLNPKFLYFESPEGEQTAKHEVTIRKNSEIWKAYVESPKDIQITLDLVPAHEIKK